MSLHGLTVLRCLLMLLSSVVTSTLAQQELAPIDITSSVNNPLHSETQTGSKLGLRLDFADNGQTRVYLDMQTGEVAQSLDRVQRLRRWWFFFLHSWDTPALLQSGWLRDFAIIVLSLGGLAVSLSGAVIGGRRLLGSR